MNESTVSRKSFGTIMGCIGAVLTLIGAILKIINYGPKIIYDLPWYLIIIGVSVIAYGVYNIVNIEKLGANIDVSRKTVKTILLNNAIILALIVMVIVIAIIEPRFLQMRVLRDILSQSSTKLIIALGIAFTLLIGGTDLSAGRMVGLASVVAASMMQNPEYANRFFPDLPVIPVLIPVVLAILACMVFGALNGILVSKFNLPPFIATLAVQVIVYGACSLYFDMPPNKSQPIGGISPSFSILGQYMLFDSIPILIIIALLFTVVIWFVLNKTVFGKNVYAIGGNRQAAVVSGINVPLTLMIIFVLAGAMYGVGGVLESARTAGATNNYGIGYELDAIAACVVGGVSLNGGVGKVRGIVIGVLIFTVIQYGLSFIGLNPNWQQVIKGIIIAASVAIDMTKYNKK